MTDITIKEYFAREGSIFSNRDAKVIGPVLEEMAKQGGVTARDVVDAARSVNSPLHKYFEWDDKIAADLYRLDQGRVMLRSIKIRYLEPDGEVREARAFQVERSAGYDNEPRKFKTFQVLHGDTAFAAQMLGSAYDDLNIWRRKYEPFTHIWEQFGDCFQHVVNQIEELAEDYRASNTAGETDDALASLLVWKSESENILRTWTSCRESIGFIFDAIKQAEEVFKAVDQRKVRNCLKCQREFDSVHAGHRICERCLNTKTLNGIKADAIMAWEA